MAKKAPARASNSIADAERGRGKSAVAKQRQARVEVKAARRDDVQKWQPPAALAAAPQKQARRSRVVPALALSSALGLMALGMLQPISDYVRRRGSDAGPAQRVETKAEAPVRLVEVSSESEAAPSQQTLASLQRMTAVTETPRQEVVFSTPVPPARPELELPSLPAIADLRTPPQVEVRVSRAPVAVPAELAPSAILVPDAGKLVAKMFARQAKADPARARSDLTPLASAAVDVEWLLAFATPDETFTDPTVPSVPMLLPEPPPGWELGAVAAIEASIPSRKRVSFVDFAMRPVPAETGERYVPEAAPRSEGYAVHPPLNPMELPDSQRLREIILAHETARKARLAAAAKAKAIAAERAAMNNIDGKSIGCLPAAIKQVLFDITRLFGPVHVNSSYRSPSHNRSVGGASRSLHMECRAVDFRVAGNHQRVMKYIVSRSEVGGYKNYGGHIHIDNGPRRSW